MNFKEYLKSWEGTKRENSVSRITILVMAAVIGILVFSLINKRTIITVQPYTLTQEAWIKKSDASKSYKEAWGFALADLLGNVTPTTVNFIEERISPLLSPRVYNEVIEALHTQAEKIRVDRVVMRFEPRAVFFDERRNRVFVQGQSFMSGSSSERPIRTPRTYEFQIEINNYAPSITYIATYSDDPRTTENLKRQEGR